tara:strand:+ start:4840 stop:5241 length:402 start_codon:yes stop_codon:yes gene_type:complete
MAKIKRSLLKDIKKAAREFKNKEAQENKSQNKPQYQSQLSYGQKRQIREEAFNDHKVKVTWNIHPGDLVKIKSRYSPTGRDIFGLVTWGIKETIQKAPYLGHQKNLRNYQSQIRVMSSAGYLFFPASGMIVIS